MMRNAYAAAHLLGEPQPGLRAADHERRTDRSPVLKEPAGESPSFRTESSSTSTLIEKPSYASNITWTVDNRPREGPKENRRRVLRKRCSHATNMVVRLA